MTDFILKDFVNAYDYKDYISFESVREEARKRIADAWSVHYPSQPPEIQLKPCWFCGIWFETKSLNTPVKWTSCGSNCAHASYPHWWCNDCVTSTLVKI